MLTNFSDISKLSRVGKCEGGEGNKKRKGWLVLVGEVKQSSGSTGGHEIKYI